jgi:IS5 family transposase
VGVDSGTVRSLGATTAKVRDSRIRDALPHGEETPVRAGEGCAGAGREAAFDGPGKDGKLRGVVRKAPKGGPPHPPGERIDRPIAMIRAGAEHPFRVPERQFGCAKTRCRGLAGSRARLFTLFAPGNPFPVRRRPMR